MRSRASGGCATSGREALQKAQEAAYDAVVLDLAGFPAPTARDLRRMRELQPDCR
jgi:CheY-like chemotaxis protein